MEQMSREAIGASVHTIDPDGRFIVPQRMRDLLGDVGDVFIITRGVEKCLWMLPERVFTSLVQKWTGPMSLLDRNSRMLDWRFIGQAVQVKIDKQYRVVVPPELLRSAGIEAGAGVIALGMLNRVEIWDNTTWRQYEQSLSSEDVQQSIDEKLGLKSSPEPVEQ